MDIRQGSSPKTSVLAVAALTLTLMTGTVPAQQPKPSAQINPVQQLLATGQKHFDQGRFDEAFNVYTQVLSLAQKDPKASAIANLRIGSIYLAQRKPDKAVASFQRTISLSPNMAEAHNFLGEALGELKQYTQAIESFSKAVALDPTLLRARYNMGVTYARMGNAKYSEFVFRTLIKNSPDYSLAYDGLAVTLSRTGRPKEAIPLHEKAISLAPNEPSYYYNLGLSYLILGNTEKALEQQEKLRTIDTRVADQLASVIIKRRMG